MSGQEQIARKAADDTKALNTTDHAAHDAAMKHMLKDAQNIHHHGGAIAEQAYWDAVRSNAAKLNLPDLKFTGDKAHVTSVRDGGGHALFDGGIHSGEGPYHDFMRQGMKPEEAKAAAHTVMEQTGKTEFKQGERFKVNPDGSVTSHLEDRRHPGNFVETTFKDKKVVQTTDTNVNGVTGAVSSETRDKDGHVVSSMSEKRDINGKLLSTAFNGPAGGSGYDAQGNSYSWNKDGSTSYTGNDGTTSYSGANGSGYYSDRDGSSYSWDKDGSSNYKGVDGSGYSRKGAGSYEWGADGSTKNTLVDSSGRVTGGTGNDALGNTYSWGQDGSKSYTRSDGTGYTVDSDGLYSEF